PRYSAYRAKPVKARGDGKCERESAGSSSFRMRSGVRVAAGRLCGRKFHEFDAIAVGIVYVVRPFAVATDFRLILALQSVGTKFRRAGFDVFDAEREMILYSQLGVICRCGDVQHEFDPVVTIGHLDLIPVGVRILEPAIPIETKAKKIGIKLLF